MNLAPIFHGSIANGQILIDARHIGAFNGQRKMLEGRNIEIVLRERFPKPRHRAHGYYRGIVLKQFAEGIGETESALHRALTAELIPVDVERPELGGRSTADLDAREYREFVDGVIMLAGWCGVTIAEPGVYEEEVA